MTTGNLIPRRVFFDNPDRVQPRISHDGKHISFLAPVDGVMNVWICQSDNVDAAQPLTNDSVRGISQYMWAYNNRHIIYRQDIGGDEDWHVYVTDIETGETTDLTPFQNVAAQFSHLSHRYPDDIVIGLNDRNAQLHDLYRIDMKTGERQLLIENEGFAGFLLDDQFGIRIGIQPTPDGGFTVFKRTDAQWVEWSTIGLEDSLTTQPVMMSKTENTVYAVDSRNRDTAALVEINLDSDEVMVIAENSLADINDVMFHPKEGTVQAASYNYERVEWIVLDEAVSADFKTLAEVANGEIDVVSRTLDDQTWLVAFLMDNGPVRYYRYDRASKQATFLFSSRSALENYELAPMHSAIVPARDGLNLVCYYTLPPDSVAVESNLPTSPLPMILFVHGGPWARDSWGYHPVHQLFANRGYAVMSVNFRGSTGFGKAFLNAGNLEWGRKMHDDLLDAVDWAVENGIAKRDAVAIGGGSYGGYATLAGLTLTPDVFACGFDIVGPSSLITLVESVPPYWQPMIEQFARRMGDHRTEEGRAMLNERSPLNHVDKIRRPLLIGQGANDPRVKQPESDQIVAAMQAQNIPVTYVLYPDEGHGFKRPENSLSFWGITEAFLGGVLEQDFEPIGDALAGSSTQVLAGAEGVVGLVEALENMQSD